MAFQKSGLGKRKKKKEEKQKRKRSPNSKDKMMGKTAIIIIKNQCCNSEGMKT